MQCVLYGRKDCSESSKIIHQPRCPFTNAFLPSSSHTFYILSSCWPVPCYAEILQNYNSMASIRACVAWGTARTFLPYQWQHFRFLITTSGCDLVCSWMAFLLKVTGYARASLNSLRGVVSILSGLLADALCLASQNTSRTAPAPAAAPLSRLQARRIGRGSCPLFFLFFFLSICSLAVARD